MQKRRERVEKWRKEKNKGKSDLGMVVLPKSKSWNLEEDDEDEEEESKNNKAAIVAEETTNNKQETEEDDDDVDPLDAYMQVCMVHSKNQYQH